MQVQVMVRKSEATVSISQKSGKPYAQQQCGVLFPGEEFHLADRMLVEIRDGKAVPHPVGNYTAEASVSKQGLSFEVDINYRTLKPVPLASAQTRAA